ncbi:MAG: carboxypeptidase-like regulatory domain-containing protein [Gemmatimonadota bacterium]
MRRIFHRATTFILPIVLAAGCSDDGPSGPDPGDGATLIAGRFTATEAAASAGLDARSLGLAQGDDFVGDEALAGVTIEIVDGGGSVVSTTATDDSGEFSAEVEAGTYTVNVLVGDQSVLSFTLDVPDGGSLFAEGKVDVLPNGKLKLDVQIFRDNDGDGEPDDTFRIRITGRVEGQPASGDTDVVASQEDIEDQVTICHVPPGNPDNAHTIVVGAPAVPAHLNHGDFEGECDGDEGATDEDLNDDGEGDETDAVKVLVCHIPPGNPENAREIEISEDALEAHLAHGDTEGECPEESAESDVGDGGEGG